ncbi:CDP-alcohol phosphatidyltransferase family protein [Candidatus Roizmanbacteria bacterium]|nr:CDP-alcohol phosphatidyltransferase family protein [Candidatus Roizmanbacteria bacterium]
MFNSSSIINVSNYLFSIEQYNHGKNTITAATKSLLNGSRLKGQEIIGWERILAEARARFLYELAVNNHLIGNQEVGSVLEVDDGRSQLGAALKKYGFQTETIDVSQIIDSPNQSISLLPSKDKYTFGVTHTLLEHFPLLEKVSLTLDSIAEKSQAMIHQVHASDIPAFDWDETHRIRKTRQEWEKFFKDWASNKVDWTHLGNHDGFNGRPPNYISGKDGYLPFYSHYDKQLIRRLIKEITAANAISVSRIPLLLTSFALAKDNPVLLSALIGVVFFLDSADGYAARKGLGNSPMGPHLDIGVDHMVEIAIVTKFAYEMNLIPHAIPWILAARNCLTDFMRLYNAFIFVDAETHPHKSFGTFDNSGRFISAAVKTIEGVVLPIFPSLGVHLSIAHVLASLYRGLPIMTSEKSRLIYKHILERIASRLRK